MKVLVTGGTGVVGKPAIDELIERGHEVRLLSRHADEDAGMWNGSVEAWPGSVADPDSIRGAADGCEVVLHIAGIAREDPPEITFQKVNIEGTRNLLNEAERAGSRRFIYVSSLGAERGESDYHKSKRRAEELVQEFSGGWLILRPGNVYGPGDEVISLLLKMVRALPAVPVVGNGDHPIQPICALDVAKALAIAVERNDLDEAELALAGADRTNMKELIAMLGEMEDKNPMEVPVPDWLAALGTGAADWLGLGLPITRDQITMLTEGNYLRDERENALTTIFGIEPMPLRDGLRWLAESLPEITPEEGSGPLVRQRFWANIENPTLSRTELFELIRREFATLPDEQLLTVDRVDGSHPVLEEGVVLRMHVPLRGTIPVRVEEVDDHIATLFTLDGHPLRGAIRFTVEDATDGDKASALRFEIRSFTRGSGPLDTIAVRTVGAPMQRATWRSVVEKVVERSGGSAPGGVQEESTNLDEDAAAGVEDWAKQFVESDAGQPDPPD